MPAKYDLERVKQLVSEWIAGDDSRIFFSHKKKSFGAVSHVCGVDNTTAMEIVADGLQKLESSSFYQQTYLSGRSVVGDVYGLESYKGHNWYVKYHLSSEDGDEYLDSVSFHPLDNEMKCESGKTLKVTYQGDRPWI